jgi:hypothetical protein
MAQNPRTLEKVHVPAKRVVKFKVGRLSASTIGVVDATRAARPAAAARKPSAPPIAATRRRRRGPTPPKPPPSNSPF